MLPNHEHCIRHKIFMIQIYRALEAFHYAKLVNRGQLTDSSTKYLERPCPCNYLWQPPKSMSVLSSSLFIFLALTWNLWHWHETFDLQLLWKRGQERERERERWQSDHNIAALTHVTPLQSDHTSLHMCMNHNSPPSSTQCIGKFHIFVFHSLLIL